MHLPDRGSVYCVRTSQTELVYLTNAASVLCQTDPHYLPDGASVPARQSWSTYLPEGANVPVRQTQCTCQTELVSLSDRASVPSSRKKVYKPDGVSVPA